MHHYKGLQKIASLVLSSSSSSSPIYTALISIRDNSLLVCQAELLLYIEFRSVVSCPGFKTSGIFIGLAHFMVFFPIPS